MFLVFAPRASLHQTLSVLGPLLAEAHSSAAPTLPRLWEHSSAPLLLLASLRQDPPLVRAAVRRRRLHARGLWSASDPWEHSDLRRRRRAPQAHKKRGAADCGGRPRSARPSVESVRVSLMTPKGLRRRERNGRAAERHRAPPVAPDHGRRRRRRRLCAKHPVALGVQGPNQAVGPQVQFQLLGLGDQLSLPPLLSMHRADREC